MLRAILSCLAIAPLAGCSTGGCGIACNPDAPMPGEPLVLEQMWRVDHKGHAFHGVAADPGTGDVHVVCGVSRDSMTLVQFDRHGRELASVKAPHHGRQADMLRLADLSGDRAPELIVSGGWSDAVTAYDARGACLWTWEAPNGVDDVCAADLTGDGRDEVIIGCNAGGIHVLNHDGTPRWRRPELGNTWNVAAAPAGPAGEVRVVSTGRGICNFFDAAGVKLSENVRILRSPDVLRFARTGTADRPVLIAADHSAFAMVCLNADGKALWRRTHRENRGGHVRDSQPSPDRPWLAVSMKDCRVVIYDVNTGDRLASTRSSQWHEVTWVPASADDPPLLVTSQWACVTAYRLADSQAAQAAGSQ